MYCAIPIEIFVREIDGAILLALELAKRKIPTVLGRKSSVTNHCLSNTAPFVYITKGVSEADVEWCNALVAANGKIVELRAEGLSFLAPLGTPPKHNKVAKSIDAWLAWGKAIVPHIQRMVPDDRRHDVVATGHPSFDLVSQKFSAYYKNPLLRQNYGDNFILINSSFGTLHCTRSFEALHELNPLCPNYFKNMRPAWDRAAAYESKVNDRIFSLIKQLRERYPQRQIVFRPHPEEKVEAYQDALGNIEGVTVQAKGSVREWIEAASLIIHHACTTGLEAVLMGKPVISYREEYNVEFVNEAIDVGVAAHSTEEVLKLVAILDEDGKLPTSDTEYITKAASILENMQQCASVTIADWIVERYSACLTMSRECWEPTGYTLTKRLRKWVRIAKNSIMGNINNPSRYKELCRAAARKFKTGSLTVEFVEKRIEALRAIDSSLPPVQTFLTDIDAVCIVPVASD
jgi:surface carbohydrate biosynthesis protein